MTDENYQKVGDNGIGGSLGTGDSWTAAMLTEIEKRIDDELKKFKAGVQGDGVISGLAVTEKGAGADQSVDVASGSCVIDGTEYTEAATVNVALDAAHGTYARWDIITYDASAGNPSKVTGTAGAIPTILDVPSGDIILALVLRAANDNVVGNAEITDKRIIPYTLIKKLDALYPENFAKKVSDTLRHSHDAEVSGAYQSYEKVKTITFPDGIKGTLRFKWDMHCDSIFYCFGKIYKNGVAIGTQKGVDGGAWETVIDDIDVGTVAAGETFELWLYQANVDHDGFGKNFRIYYDNDDPIAVDSSNS